MFTKPELIDSGHPTRHFWDETRRTIEPRLSTHIYWHNMLNDGTEPLENWPFFEEYHAYKSWFDEIEDKALDTLKTAIA